MLEIAGDGSVLFVSGAARLLTGEDSDRLTGRQFSSLIDEADRHFILNLLASLTVGGRIEPVTVRLLRADGAPGPVCVLGGCCLPRQESRYYLTLSNARLPQAEAAMAKKRDYQTGQIGRASCRERVCQYV